MSRPGTELIWRCVPLVLVVGCAGAAPADSDAFVTWASGHAVPIESLDAPLGQPAAGELRAAIGAATVVGIGESRHDTSEQLLLKALLVRHLVEQLDFRVLILEESFPHAELLDRYVTTGAGDPRAILHGLAGWYLWDTEEMLILVEWLHSVNEGRDADERVRVFGMDVTAPAPGVREALTSLAAIGVSTDLNARSLGLDQQEGDFWPATWERYLSLPDEQRQAFANNYDELVALVEANRAEIATAFSESEYARMRWLVEIGRWGNALFSAADREQGGVIRETGMSQTVLWILEHVTRGEKAIVWAHNLHVARSTFRMPELAEGTLEPMGVYLHDALGKDYVAIGATFGTDRYGPASPAGEPLFPPVTTAVMDGAMAAAASSGCLLDLRKADPASAAGIWLGHDREWRAQDANAVLSPSAAYDLVYFVPRISRAQPTPLAQQRHSR